MRLTDWAWDNNRVGQFWGRKLASKGFLTRTRRQRSCCVSLFLETADKIRVHPSPQPQVPTSNGTTVITFKLEMPQHVPTITVRSVNQNRKIRSLKMTSTIFQSSDSLFPKFQPSQLEYHLPKWSTSQPSSLHSPKIQHAKTKASKTTSAPEPGAVNRVEERPERPNVRPSVRCAPRNRAGNGRDRTQTTHPNPALLPSPFTSLIVYARTLWWHLQCFTTAKSRESAAQTLGRPFYNLGAFPFFFAWSKEPCKAVKSAERKQMRNEEVVGQHRRRLSAVITGLPSQQANPTDGEPRVIVAVNKQKNHENQRLAFLQGFSCEQTYNYRTQSLTRC